MSSSQEQHKAKPKNLSIHVPEPLFTKLDLDHLSRMINDPSVALIDVRDDDFVGGHIKGAIHASFGDFEQKHAQNLVNQLVKQQGKKSIVFTCMYSEQRGPFCASAFAEAMEKEGLAHQAKLYVLSDGFFGWLKRYVGTPEESQFIQDYDATQWRQDSVGNYLHVLDSQVLEFI